MAGKGRQALRPPPRWSFFVGALAPLLVSVGAGCAGRPTRAPDEGRAGSVAADPAAASRTEPAPPEGRDGGAAVSAAAPGRPPGEARPGVLRVVIDAEPAHLDVDRDADAWGRKIALDAIYEPLVRLDAGGAPQPMLAERWSVDDAGTRYLFHLRPEARFHDGRPVTSLDAAYTLDRVRSPRGGSPRLAAALLDVERVEMAGRLVLRLELRRRSPRLFETLAEIGILPEHLGARLDLGRHPVGTGPLRLEEWQRHRLVLSRFADYWGPPAAAARIEIAVEPDASRALLQAKRGELDLLGPVPPLYLSEQLDTPAISSRFQVVRLAAPRVALVLWNAAHPPLDDAAVRRALALAVDRRRVLEEARYGAGRPIDTVPASASPEVARGDPGRADAALDAAGLIRGSGGLRARAGKPTRLSLLVPTGSREAQVAGRLVAAALLRVGVPLEVVELDLATLLARVRRGAFDAALLSWIGIDDDDLAPLLGPRGPWPLGGEPARPLERALEALLATPARSRERSEARTALARAVQQAAPALFLYAADEVFLVSRRVAPIAVEGDFFRLRDLAVR